MIKVISIVSGKYTEKLPQSYPTGRDFFIPESMIRLAQIYGVL